jgi:hypothetical protein
MITITRIAIREIAKLSERKSRTDTKSPTAPIALSFRALKRGKSANSGWKDRYFECDAEAKQLWYFADEAASKVEKPFSLSGTDSSILTRKKGRGYKMLTAGETMQTGSHTISFKNLSDDISDPDIFSSDEGDYQKENFFCGITLQDGENCERDYDLDLNMSLCNGSVWSHGNADDSCGEAGQICCGQVLSIRVDLDNGSLKFWRDGVPHGPGIENDKRITKGPVRWLAEVLYSDCSVQIVPTPELLD